MPVVNPAHLLDQADWLSAPSRRGAPRQADLRRAISSAYYAVFHRVMTETADQFVGRTLRNTRRYALVYRSVEHRTLKGVCDEVRKQTLPKKYAPFVPAGGFDAQLSAFATASIDLQELRHSADYDPYEHVTVADAMSAIATARQALASFEAASPVARRVFLTLLAFPPR
jgi:hypothetical protein